jgi:hypothetical protein
LVDTCGSAATAESSRNTFIGMPSAVTQASADTEKEASTNTSNGSDAARLAACRTDYDRLDEIGRQSGSPPRELHLDEIIRRAIELLPYFQNKRADSVSATMDFRTINARDRAHNAGDFERSDDWNRDPRFIRVGRGIYRRLSEAERERFKRLWQSNEPLVRKPSFAAAEWDRFLIQE